jgi:hypothetical protein
MKRHLLIAALPLGLLACSGGGHSDPTPATAPVSGASFGVDDATLLRLWEENEATICEGIPRTGDPAREDFISNSLDFAQVYDASLTDDQRSTISELIERHCP